MIWRSDFQFQYLEEFVGEVTAVTPNFVTLYYILKKETKMLKRCWHH